MVIHVWPTHFVLINLILNVFEVENIFTYSVALIKFQVFQGNIDKDTMFSHVFPQHIRAPFITIWSKSWRDGVAMRVELYGCYI